MLLMVNFIISFLKIQILTGPRQVMEVNESIQVSHSGKVECEGPSREKLLPSSSEQTECGPLVANCPMFEEK